MAKVPKTRTDLAPISEIKKVTEPIGQKNVADEQVNPATEDTLAAQLDITLSALRDAIETYLERATEVSVATGDATGGSTTTLEDTNVVWVVSKWADAIAEITDISTGKHYFVTITSNTVDTLTFPAIAVDIVAGDHYQIRMVLSPTNLNKWGGSSLTGRDVSLDFQHLNADLSTLATQAELAKKVNKATTPVIYNVAMANADEEYSQALPANTKRFSIHLRDMTEFRFAYETGKVATPTEPYETIPAGSEKYEEQIEPASLTLYFASPAATKVAEIEAWS
jgi:hypothetical protein